jgi:vitamin-K-epoxide reductase (warfarin-sensitive)
MGNFVSDVIVFFAVFVGLTLSVYAVYVEYNASVDESFEAVCDFSEKVSCSKVFLSDYGKILSLMGIIPKNSVLDLPNAFYGALFYISFAVVYCLLSLSDPLVQLLLLLLSTGSMCLSAYLSYCLSEILHEMCVLCTTTYFCNFALFLVTSKLNFSDNLDGKTKKKH